MPDSNTRPNTQKNKMRTMLEMAQRREILIGAALILLIFVGYMGMRLTQHETTYSEPGMPHTAR